ncbi:MAG: 1-deoxy-D-xylulose-5-phosphate reductoisomerase [Betaproteobacteria bacterium AqS2]|uniref:1-deoxy-D-xylulose 5-phosphate reductoisomerase n=1 Tax=Candidatus Amphirhobacter heronislandensis TaxID=1732024 RepID=A0A930XY19_9GAMM|nr:1-deoxy-D-xylulose-5-phosphate reductoisomerase [Betaproteobacteria bacterium AqS2]
MSAAAPLAGTRAVVLGATGHVGRLALEVAARAGCEVVAVAAGGDDAGLLEICRTHRPAAAALADAKAAGRLRDAAQAAGIKLEVLEGDAGVAAAAAWEADLVVAAIGGVAGALPTMRAVEQGRRVLLANKEALVTGGEHMLAAARKAGAELVPVDSEHGALLELLHLARDRRDRVARLWLPASGGPFHGREVDLREVSPAEAGEHPVWPMGRKITIDSATLMNKGLEVIEAALLFGLPAERIEVVIHPQCVVHGMVDLEDGGTIAHCAQPDMRHALARAFFWPEPHGLRHEPVAWAGLGRLDFLPPDSKRFRCLALARDALRGGGVAPAVLNAANEVAVASFCANAKVRFADIPPIIEDALAAVDGPADSFEDMVEADRRARAHALSFVARNY